MPAKVGYMQKITLSLETQETRSVPDQLQPNETEPQPTIEFVYGLSPGGLTPFEFALAEKTAGDEIQLQLDRNKLPEFFGHIAYPAVFAAGDSESIVLEARVLAISPASSREVVRTLADIANCGDSCCGHH